MDWQLKLLHLPRNYKRILLVSMDALFLPLAIWSALTVRLSTFSVNPIDYWVLSLAAVLIGIPVFFHMGLYRTVIRYMGPQAANAVLIGVSVVTLAIIAVSKLFPPDAVMPRSCFIIFWLLAVLYVGGSRFMARAIYHRFVVLASKRQTIAIYGAGNAGMQLASALARGEEYSAAVFIDDNPAAWGTLIQGLEVYSPADLSSLIEKFSIKQVLMALPSISRSRRQEILDQLEPLSVHVLTVPSMPELISGKVKVDQVREVDIEDLLGRDAAEPDKELLCECVDGKQVLVTGAGGSIGSELCRQIISCNPKQLILFEISEFGLYSIEKEILVLAEDKGTQVEIVPILGSVQNQHLLEQVLNEFSVDVVFHAAAYKHVPLVEHNVVEGVKNNVLGTLAVAKAADIAGVGTFVLVSTDKAVRPTNIMGATKRMAELILQGMAQASTTCFCMVRFGNVLGSSGSVVPLFREQIKAGGPVTVTHPDTTRYFMSIPEAAQLVIQTGALARGGDVFVLDMGQPVKIHDLAKKMIHLMGFQVRDEQNPEGEIAIEFIGLRPGEKLHEELWLGKDLSGTANPKIMRAKEQALKLDEVTELVAKLEKTCISFDYDTIKELLAGAVEGFKPDREMVDVIWQRKKRHTH